MREIKSKYDSKAFFQSLDFDWFGNGNVTAQSKDEAYK
jgi:hypothetical protein